MSRQVCAATKICDENIADYDLEGNRQAKISQEQSLDREDSNVTTNRSYSDQRPKGNGAMTIGWNNPNNILSVCDICH